MIARVEHLSKSCIRFVRNKYHDVRFREFSRIRTATDGLLTPRVYREIYEVAKRAPDRDVLDIGGAGGGSTVCCALAAMDANKSGKVVCVEKCEGGSRVNYGSYDLNYRRLLSNLKEFEVQDRVVLFTEYLTFENAERVKRLISGHELAGFIHDADGRLDRDFYLFWEMVVDGGFIIVDDYREERRFRPISERYPAGGTKKLLTYKLLNKLLDWGLLEIDKQIGEVVFAHKPAGVSFSRFDQDECNRIIRAVKREHANSQG